MSIIFDGRQFICFYCSIREETKEYNKEKPWLCVFLSYDSKRYGI
jgi:hypothetical protein